MEESLTQKSPKRLRPSASSGGLMDRISDLPDYIVQHIISFLPTKDAIKFCTLSREWDSLWKSIPNLLFYCESPELKEINQFVSFVDKTLTMYTSSKISKFLLEFPYRHSYAIKAKVDSWISFAKRLAEEELCVSFTMGCPLEELSADFEFTLYKKDRVLYDNCSAMKMCLTSIHFYYSGEFSVHWTALKVLSLVGSRLNGDIIRAVFLGSPLIEFLAIRKCALFKNCKGNKCVIDVSCASLKELVIDTCVIFHGQLEITGPNLLSLAVVGVMSMKTLKLVDMTSLVDATIDFYSIYSCPRKGKDLASHKNIQKSLLHKLRHVNTFTVGPLSLQVVSKRKVEGAFFGKSRRKFLKVTMNWNKAYLPGLAALLKSSPDLEQLTIKIIPAIDSQFKVTGLPEDDHFGKVNYWRSEIGTAKSLFRNLKIVNIVGFLPSSPSEIEKAIVELAEFLLASAKELQKLIIHAEATFSRFKWLSELELFQKLLSCPKASANAVVIFKN